MCVESRTCGRLPKWEWWRRWWGWADGGDGGDDDAETVVLPSFTQVPQEVAQGWCKEKNIPYYEVSAKNDINVVQAFEMLASRALSRVSGAAHRGQAAPRVGGVLGASRKEHWAQVGMWGAQACSSFQLMSGCMGSAGLQLWDTGARVK